MDAGRAMERSLLDAGFEDAAQYAVPMAFRIRFVMQMTAREAMHLTELRSQPQGHPTYRRVAQAMHRLISEVHPSIGAAFELHELRGRRSGTTRGRAPNGGEAAGRPTRT